MPTLNLRGKQKGRVAHDKAEDVQSRAMHEHEESDGLVMCARKVDANQRVRVPPS
jgi:hypothetical protein